MSRLWSLRFYSCFPNFLSRSGSPRKEMFVVCSFAVVVYFDSVHLHAGTTFVSPCVLSIVLSLVVWNRSMNYAIVSVRLSSRVKSGCHTSVTVNRVKVRRSDNQRRRFCAMLLGPPEEIALCALSTHYTLAAASFNPGSYTLLPLWCIFNDWAIITSVSLFLSALSAHRRTTPPT